MDKQCHLPLCLGALLISASAYGQCAADLNNDGAVDAFDLSEVLVAWGQSGAGDVNGDGAVDGNDLAVVVSSWGASCPVGPPTEVKLTCQAIAVAPFVSFVRTFTAGSTVRVGIDPALTPVAADATADVWVVANRSAAEWATNDSLQDVRGTPQTIQFGATLAANVFELTGGATLSGDGNLAVGRGYDLVVDVNRDGRLGAGDLIDGGGNEAGLWIARDPTATGPLLVTSLSSYTASGATAGFTTARLWYPTSIALLGQRPLVVISHGNGHQYSWYDYLGTHLASWGFIVISHQNNTVPGIETASTTTLQHTSAIIAQQATVAGGAINGRIDVSRIGWIGHSRGGEGIARAYDRIFDNSYTPTGYGLANIKFLCSIAPTDFLGASSANPHAANFMLLWGAADGDVSGVPNNTVAWSFDLAERCTGFRNTVYVHGADHNDFNCCGTNDFQGPSGTAINNAGAQAVAKAFILAALKYHLESETALGEFLWRPSSSLRPPGVSAAFTIVKEVVPAASANVRTVDNFQTETGLGTSSSGGAVASTVTNISEAIARDTDNTYTWSTSNPHNGSIRATSSDTQRMVAWDWNVSAGMTWDLLPALRDLSSWTFVQARVGQGTRHPNTVTLNGGASFTWVLKDSLGNESRVSSSAYGEAINRPYQRTGSGTGTGWQNELRTVQLRLRDFKSVNPLIDLSQIASVRMEVGGSAGSTTGRFVIDDLQFVKE
jgi:hypothetical protein